MAKISKIKLKLHQEALSLVRSDKELTMREKEFILENYKPDATHNVTSTNAFFTPMILAQSATIEMPNPDEYDKPVRILDLCAGVGMLSFAYYHYSGYDTRNVEIVCIEIEKEYVEVGKRILPEATWIQSDIMDKSLDKLEEFDCFISNPPFMKIGPYKGTYTTSYIGMTKAKYGVVIVPQNNCPFIYSGKNQYKEVMNRDYNHFSDMTNIRFASSCIDTDTIEDLRWDNVKIVTEVVIVDFLEKLPA